MPSHFVTSLLVVLWSSIDCILITILVICCILFITATTSTFFFMGQIAANNYPEGCFNCCVYQRHWGAGSKKETLPWWVPMRYLLIVLVILCSLHKVQHLYLLSFLFLVKGHKGSLILSHINLLLFLLFFSWLPNLPQTHILSS